MKKIIVYFTCILLLSGCNNTIKEGETLTLSDSIIVGETIEDYEIVYEEAASTGKIKTGGPIEILFDDDVIKVIEINKNDMVLIEVIKGFDEGTLWWISKDNLKLYI